MAQNKTTTTTTKDKRNEILICASFLVHLLSLFVRYLALSFIYVLFCCAKSRSDYTNHMKQQINSYLFVLKDSKCMKIRVPRSFIKLTENQTNNRTIQLHLTFPLFFQAFQWNAWVNLSEPNNHCIHTHLYIYISFIID